jgi:sialate O-acetylesterase
MEDGLRFNKCFFVTVLLFAFIPVMLPAQTVLPKIFSDHMVLQRQLPIPVWGKSAPGATVTVSLADAQKATTADKDGKWRVELPARPAGGPFTLTVTAGGKTISFKDVLLGDVWMASGQSNMSMPMRPVPPYTMGVTDYEHEIAAANELNVRFFVVPEEADFPEQTEMHGDWLESKGAQVCNVSAVAYYFARKVNRDTGVPIAVIDASVGSTGLSAWVNIDVNRKAHPDAVAASEKLLQEHVAEVRDYERDRPDFDKRTEESIRNNCGPSGVTKEHTMPFPNFIFKPSGLYNAMIAPFHQVPIKGVLWYQGDADSHWYAGYSDRMKELIDSWRASWHQPDIPFYWVMLQNVTADERFGRDYDPKNDFYPFLREQQRIALSKISHGGMAVATDVGDPMFPHPRNKKAVGERLALIALANDYGVKVVSSGPMLKSVSHGGDQLFLKFDTFGSPLRVNTGTVPGGFEIAGADGKYHPAMATVNGDTVTLSSPLVKDPRNARYGWKGNPYLSLYNAAGLPAPPFTTEPQP